MGTMSRFLEGQVQKWLHAMDLALPLVHVRFIMLVYLSSII